MSVEGCCTLLILSLLGWNGEVRDTRMEYGTYLLLINTLYLALLVISLPSSFILPISLQINEFEYGMQRMESAQLSTTDTRDLSIVQPSVLR